MEALISIVGSILGSLASKAAEYTVDPIARQVSYLFKHESKFQNLKTQLQKLEDERERMQQSVDEANRKSEEIFVAVDRWMTEVNGKISEQAATQLKEDEVKATKRCFAGFCPDFKSRYQLSKKVEKEANTIAQLLNQKDQFNDRVSYRPAPKGRSTRPVEDYEAFESRSNPLNRVMEALEDDNFNIIGVYGMGGVGKTTLVKEVARQAKEKQLLDEVVLVAVTQNPGNIQNEIAEKLGLKFDETSIDVRGSRLRGRLKKEKKVLIILDDIWEPLDLEALGIPSRDEHKGCKILMTSRKLDVLKSMNSQKNLPIDILKGDESWKLFKNMAGDIVERSDLQSTAIKVSQKCAGLPITIATVAKALRHKENLFEWTDALEQLKRRTEVNVGGMPSDVYSAIKLSYNFLENEEVKQTFLLCSIMGHNAAIEDLLRYCRGLGLFRGLNTIEKVRNKVLTLVSELKDSFLLLASSTPDCFDMHDVVCDVAISIASRDHQWLVGEEDVFAEWSDKETIRNFNAIILRFAKVSELPDELECPNLTFLSMRSEDSSLKIPNNFFKQTQRLKVLDFAEMHFSSLPSSIGSLKTLCTLCFLGCVLEDIAIIGELKNLEILDLRRSRIEMLPEKIGQLTKLKLLDLSDCEDLKIISPNVLAGLSRLEELYLYNSFDRWEVEGHDNSRSNASLVELQHLSHLTTLAVHIHNEQALPKDELFFEKLERYKISIGDECTWRECDEMETSRMLKLKMNESIHLYEGVKKLLSETENLWLDDVKNVMDVLYAPNTEGLPHLKHLCVRNVSAMKLISCKEFPLLESLSLCNLINLEAICYGQLKAGSFGQLRVIKVGRCKVLKNLFSFSIARELRQLREIEVCECENLTELIAEKKEEEIGANEVIDILEFNQLLCLRLQDLPSFIRFCNYSGKKLSSSQQGNVQSNAILLFDQKVVFPAIKELELRSLSSIEKLWDDQFPAAVMSFGFQNLSSLVVTSCHKLKYAFPSSMVKSFVQLKTLVVRECEDMEEVIAVSAEEERNKIMVFPKLESLDLCFLPNLKRFCYGINPIEFPVLRELRIFNCSLLNTFHCDCTRIRNEARKSSSSSISIPKYLFDEKVVFPAIKELVLESMSSIEKLWDDQLPAVARSFGFQNLSSLEVKSCHDLKNVFTSSMVKSFVQLKTLVVVQCEEMEEIITVSAKEERNKAMVFPKLDYLYLDGLSNLRRFSCGINPIKFPVLRKLKITECPALSTFHCDSITNVGKSSNSISKDHNLQIDVPHCLFNDKVVFPAIEELVLESMSSIEKLWDDQLPAVARSFGFQNLSSLEVKSCYNLKNVFTSSMVKSFVQLKTLVVVRCEEMEEIITVSANEGRNKAMVFPKLDYLYLDELSNLRRFCCGINPIKFPALRKLKITECPALSTFHCDSITNVGKSSNSILKDHNLQIDVPHCLFNDKVTLPMLQHLEIHSMENLERLWPNQLAEQFFSKLGYFELKRCDKLVNVFPLSKLTRLESLEKLIIWDCELVEEIFEPQQADGSTAAVAFEFPLLTSLELIRLPKLKNFYHKMHSINWPSLKEIEVIGCDKVEILFGFQETSREKSEYELISIQQPLFWVNKYTFPTQLTLGWNNGMKEMLQQLQQQLLASHYSKLKVVRLYDFPEQLAIFPSYLLHLLSFPNLEKLEICVASFKEIFPSEGVGEEKSESARVLLSRLTELRLKYLPELMHLWKEKEGCPKLKNNLVPSTVSFKNLVTLEVARCDGIIKLVAYSTAKSLVQLKEMKIWSCENIEEITQGSGYDEDEAKDEISFPQLNVLELIGLSKLESFCSSGNYTFGFPSLVTVILQNCPKMKMFSQGDSNTPLLHKVRLQTRGNYEERWEGNLNSTVQQLFKEKNAMAREDEEYEDEILEEHQEDEETSEMVNFKDCKAEDIKNFLKLTQYQILVDGCHMVCPVPTTARGGAVYSSCLEHVPFYSKPCAEFHCASGYFWWPYHQYTDSRKLCSAIAPHSFSYGEGLRPINPKDIEWKNGKNPISMEVFLVFPSCQVKKLVLVEFQEGLLISF
ncbi:uncharacterized protein LOC111277501 [Durio zibethinus]|uniref:Uncharacterized protein LOC111277501 n=1 Tax=Durio zibethinus TaxID=66656 RepID=A0A6P5WV07_DURZI|nr:uncharacterized protein LOC111277501 [Durio zibethinus]